MKSSIGLFEAYGIEIELMVVDNQTLNVRPIVDTLLTDAAGILTSDYEDGPITWSNELVSHVVEFKTTRPAKDLAPLENEFFESQRRASEILARHGARLMPTGMHPWMNPLTETKLWPHDNGEIYTLYNSIFNCRGHGWSNLQSVHLNLPFKNESEFKRLHSVVRAVLPLIPSLSASSPIADAKQTGLKDTRLAYYETNQERLPIIAGDIVPVPIKSFDDYRQRITTPIQAAIKPFDPKGLLVGDWLNSRGAIARIDRGTIEIRLLDTQECAGADLTIVKFIVHVIQNLITDSDFLTRADRVATETLHAVYKSTVENAESAWIDQSEYLALFAAEPSTAQNLWTHIFHQTKTASSSPLKGAFEALLARPSLASRIQSAAGFTPTTEELKSIYLKLCDCLDRNLIFCPSI